MIPVSNRKRVSILFSEIDLHNQLELLEFMAIEYKGLTLAEWTYEWIVKQLDEKIDWNNSNADLLFIKNRKDFMEIKSSSNKINAPKFLEFVDSNFHFIQSIQTDIQKHIKDIYNGQKKIDELDEKFNGNNFKANSLGLEHSEELLKKINQIKFGFEYVLVGKDNPKLRTVIQQKIENFEQLIYKDFMDHLNEQQRFITCTHCSEVIADASNTQIHNFYHKGVALHKKTCQADYLRKKATLRQQAWRREKIKIKGGNKNG
jgi:hypothetical protein